MWYRSQKILAIEGNASLFADSSNGLLDPASIVRIPVPEVPDFDKDSDGVLGSGSKTRMGSNLIRPDWIGK